MNNNIKYVLGTLIFLWFISQSLFIVEQRETAIVIQFGEAIRTIAEPGLKIKAPMIQNVIFFDKRVQNLSAGTTEVIASDQKTMRVDAFTKYKIIDALKFYQSAKDERNFKNRLSPIVDSSLRQVLGGYEFKALLTPERAKLMQNIKEIVDREASDFGIKIVDVRIMRADLPDRSREAVYDRMKSEREKEAKEIRAEGSEQAQKIMATAERDKQILLADAKRQSDIIRGEGDAQAIKAFSSSFNKDPEFFSFYRSLQAYKKTISKDNTKIVVSPDSEFMKHFKAGN
jgi:membrane protease subunit HflC